MTYEHIFYERRLDHESILLRSGRARGGSREERTIRMRPGGKSNEESPFFEKPILSFEGRVGNVAPTTPSRPASLAES